MTPRATLARMSLQREKDGAGWPWMFALRRLSVILVLAVAVSSCGTYRGVSEFSVYRDTYARVHGLGNTLLDRLAVHERTLFQIGHPFDPKTHVFNPDHAAYYVEEVDPPLTAASRRTLDAVRTYNDALYGLASGEDAEALAGKLARLGAIGTAAATDVAVLSGAGLVPEVATAIAINKILASLKPLAGEVIGVFMRERFRERLLEQAPTIREALEKVRASAKILFDKEKKSTQAKLNKQKGHHGPDWPEDKTKQLRMSVEVLSTFVILTEASILSLDLSVAAIKSDDDRASLDGLLLVSERLSAALQAARRQLHGGS